MGSLTLPDSGCVNLDSSAVIYSVEQIEPYLALVAPVWRPAQAGQFTILCSELVLAEMLVLPLRRNLQPLVSAYRNVFAAPDVRLIAATRKLWEDCARLRATTGLKTADALHAVTAQEAGCDLFVTNDADFRRVEGLPTVVLDDLVA